LGTHRDPTAADPEPDRKDEPGERPRPSIPLLVVAGALVVAVAAVSILIFVLFKKTTGPAQVVREYYSAVAARDCDSAYDVIAPDLSRLIPRSRFCGAVDARRSVPTGVQIDIVTGCGEPPARFALVSVRELGPDAAPEDVQWQMVRIGGSWKIAAFPPNRRPVAGLPSHAEAPAECLSTR
jgi:hypothetical protein